MKIAFIFTPFIVPSYIPLGIAQLKSYIRKKVPSAKVYNLDLNIDCFNNLASSNYLQMFKNLCAICPQKCKGFKTKMSNLAEDGMAFQIGIRGLKLKRDGMFYDIAKYNYFSQIIRRFFNNRGDCIDVFAKELIKKGISVPADFENLFDDDVRKIAEIDPDFVGFSIFCKTQLSYSLILAGIIKRKLGLPVIFGGAFMNHLNIKEFLDCFSFVDFVISKEGERGIVGFIKHFPKKEFSKVPGLYYRQAKNVVHNEEKYIEHLDDLPSPDFSDFKFSQYLLPAPVLPIIFSRGCYWNKCTFCTYYKNHPAPYKTKSIKKLIAEIKYYRSNGINHFFIDDDVISASDLKKISVALKRNKIRIFFGAIVRPETGFTYNVLKTIYSGGGRVLIWGVESSCQRILDLMNKGTRTEPIKSILKCSKEAGFHNHLFMIQGFPTETEREICGDYKFLIKNRDVIDSFFLHTFSLERGSYIFRNPGKFKIGRIEPIPMYTSIPNKAILHSDIFAFKRDVKLNWVKVKGMKRKIFKLPQGEHAKKFRAVEHSQILLHASLSLDQPRGV